MIRFMHVGFALALVAFGVLMIHVLYPGTLFSPALWLSEGSLGAAVLLCVTAPDEVWL